MSVHRLTKCMAGVLCVAVAAFLGGGAQAALTAQVVKLTGKAEFRTGATAPWQDLKEKGVLNQAATIRTSEGASVTLSIGGKSFIVVHELSTLTLASLKEETPLKQDIQLSLDAGKLWSKLAKKDPNDKTTMSVRTPVAVGSVRGTSFYVEANPKANSSCFGVWEGVVLVDAFAAGGLQQKVEAGFCIEVGALVTDNLRAPDEARRDADVMVAGAAGGDVKKVEKSGATLAQADVGVSGSAKVLAKAKQVAEALAEENVADVAGKERATKDAAPAAVAATPAAAPARAEAKKGAPSLMKMGKAQLDQQASFEQNLKAAGI